MFDLWVTQTVTLRDMFAHRSGLPDHAGDLLEDLGYSRAEVLHRLRFQHPDSSFRSEYAYTNFGLTEAAVAAADAAGKSWEDLSRERLYQPLGMSSTSSRHADFISSPNHAQGHVLVDRQWVAKFDRDPDAQSPAGGVSSSVRDMAQWMRLQLGDGVVDGRQLVASGPLRETHFPLIMRGEPETSTDRASFYGLGWNVSYDEAGRVRLSHSGGFALGAATAVMLVPAEQLGIVVLTNAAPVGVAEAVGLSFLDLALVGMIQRDWLATVGPAVAAAAQLPYGAGMDYSQSPEPQGAPHGLDSYVGTYENDFFGPVEVSSSDGQLVLREGPNLVGYALRHWEGDVFLYQPKGENAGGLSRVNFAVGSDQSAASVTIENLDIDGEGTFVRAHGDGQ
jgi:CubicO group peptidase (beta-lactamase class C family)